MAIIKCKMCGGDIEISADKTFGTCEYCGSTMTLPKTDDDQRLSLFNRGTHLRRNGEFDKAAAIYERLIGENDADAEAHWNLLLCRYGIEYVQDPASGERIPTCHRASFDSILNDVDYQAALKYSDGVARSLYEKEAQRIAALQKDILAISQKETPFDVFICYKESDESGKRTKDSALAQDIYYQLTDAGYKVFFARITLEDKLGQEYEPYIFAALHSAKVMVVVGTKPEYLNAVWVKNEWSRYLALMRTDRSRLLIPCYRDMDPYDMPEELSMLQSQDMGKIGFIQDLIRGVKKVVDAAKPQEAVTETVKETVVVHNEGGSNVQALLKRGNMALEDGEWGKADEFFEQVLNQDAECGMAYLGKFLAKARKASAQAYAQSRCAGIAADAPTERNTLACEEDQAFIDACVQRYQVEKYYAASEIRKMLGSDRYYCADRAAYFRDAQKQTMQRLDDDRNFTRAEKFAAGETKVQCEALRTGLTNALRQQEQTAEQEAAAEKQRVTEAYRAFLKETEPKLAAKQKQALAKQEDEQKRKEEFERLRAEQKKRAEEAEKLAAQEAKLKAAKTKKLTIIGVTAAVVIIAAVLLITKVIIPSSNYSKAEELLAAGDYDGAITIFSELDYKDSHARMIEASNARDYADAETLQNAGETAEAAILFGKLGNYHDARERSFTLWNNVAQRDSIGAGAFHTIGLKTDGTVYAAGRNTNGQCDVSGWTDIIAVSASYNVSAGLKADGTVVTTGETLNLSDWDNIVSISVNEDHMVGLRTDGTVVAAGKNEYGQCNVSDWENIMEVSAGRWFTVGLKVDGTVVATGINTDGQCDVSKWSEITAIAAGAFHTVGLKKDGTVVAIGIDEDKRCSMKHIVNTVAIAAGTAHTAALRADGTVISRGWEETGQNDVSDWTDIVAIAAGNGRNYGIKSDGTVVFAGRSMSGEGNVFDWTDIKIPN